MIWINNITEDAIQQLTIKLDDGTTAQLNMKYLDGQQGWFYGLTYGTFELINRRVVVGVNMLRAFRNIIPFGLACQTQDGQEAIFQDDFSSGRASIYLLNPVDVAGVEQVLSA